MPTPKEAPEGIVSYSSSGIPTTTFSTHQILFGSVHTVNNNETSIFNTKLNDGTIKLVSDNLYIDYSDIFGDIYKTTEKLVLSKNFIETLDLVSEGEIEGPVSGEYIYSGNIGQTGWNIAVFSGYSAPTGYENSRWLRSIYYNQTPILSDKSQFNFQNVDVSYVKGLPNGVVVR